MDAYLCLEDIVLSEKAPVARIETDVMPKSSAIKSRIKQTEFHDDQISESGERNQYPNGVLTKKIDHRNDTVEFTNGLMLHADEATRDVPHREIRHIYFREMVDAHLDKKKKFIAQSIKILSLFSLMRW